MAEVTSIVSLVKDHLEKITWGCFVLKLKKFLFLDSPLSKKHKIGWGEKIGCVNSKLHVAKGNGLVRASGIVHFFPANYALVFGELCAQNPELWTNYLDGAKNYVDGEKF